MIVIDYVGEPRKLNRVVLERVRALSYSNFQKLLRKKDIKINGRRVGLDEQVKNGDRIEVFAPDSMLSDAVPPSKLKIVYEDQNILVADKPSGIEVVSNGRNDTLEDLVQNHLDSKAAKAVHRLDRNTRGLVMFAKTHEAEQELLRAIKNHEIKKIYEAIVVGDLLPHENTLVAYLKTDKEKAISHISISPKQGYSKIITKYKVLEEYGDSTLVEIDLVTGKTHQIRAHMAHIGHPLVGDGKYGDNMTNRKFGEKKQMLIAKRLVFAFGKTSKLYYLNGKKIESHQTLK